MLLIRIVEVCIGLGLIGLLFFIGYKIYKDITKVHHYKKQNVDELIVELHKQIEVIKNDSTLGVEEAKQMLRFCEEQLKKAEELQTKLVTK
jgi:hypothetical protein